ncbi:tyrosine-type recombinase/integrase [Baekduia soli]|uniref:tyrosine-type recombinase/integrase n=1 Tax=Baekduia soli TaxID=496014 RepID=UPI002AA29C83|nr:tyrosine-type recombinase/integrase [Baekduia soli]
MSGLRAHHKATEWPGPEDVVFSSHAGTHLNVQNVRTRCLKPAAEEIGALWIGFHTFRHTCASLLFARGANAVQAQKWLGHHSPSFTLDTYVHLLTEDSPGALDLTFEAAAPTGGWACDAAEA